MTGAAAFMTWGQTTVTVDASPDEISGYSNTGAAANISTGMVIAIPSGGVPAYTYAWTQVGSSPYTWVISAATSASTYFTCNTLGAGATAEADFLVTVTDSTGAKGTATVRAFANNGQPYDPIIRDHTLRGSIA